MAYTPLEPLIKNLAPGKTLTLDRNIIYSFPGVAQNNDPLRPVIKQGATLDGNGAAIYIEPTADSLDIDALFGEDGSTIRNVYLRVSDKVITSGAGRRKYKINGIWIEGDGKISHCNLGGLYGNKSTEREAFGFKIKGRGSIEHCHIHNLTGDYHTCLAVGSGGIKHNNIIAEPSTGKYTFAINLGASRDVVAHSNTIEGIYTPFYIDWKDTSDCRAYNNKATSCTRALHIKTQEMGTENEVPRTVERVYLLDNKFIFVPEIRNVNNLPVTYASALIIEHTRHPWSPEPAYLHTVKDIVMRYNTYEASVDEFYLANIASNNPDEDNAGVRRISIAHNTVLLRDDTKLLLRNQQDRARNSFFEQATRTIHHIDT